MPRSLDFPSSERFELRREVGSGGMGVVYEAFDRELERRVALKTLRNLDENSLYLFKNEFRSLCSIRHPNLVQLFELQCVSNFWFFTMEFVEGRDFRSFVCPNSDPDAAIADAETSDGSSVDAHQNGAARLALASYDEGRLRRTCAQVARGVATLHRAGKIHRDLKPTNVLVSSSDERAVLLDFGLVTDLDQRRDLSEMRIVGTAQYMSPEQASGGAVTPASDWYAFGVMLYEALTGRLPFDGHPLFVLQSKQNSVARPPSSWVEAIPAELDELCQALLSRDPTERPDERAILDALGVDSNVRSGPHFPRTDAPSFSLVGRRPELDALREALDELDQGLPLVMLIEGASGVGKTALTQSFLSSLRDATVFEGRCYERESVPYKAVDSVVDALVGFLRHADPDRTAYPPGTRALAQIFPIVRRLPHLLAAFDEPLLPMNPLEQRNRAFSALRALIDEVARSRRLVVFIDDIHWTDSDSVTLLLDLLRPPDAPPVFLLLTSRPLADAESAGDVESAGQVERLLGAISARQIALSNLAGSETTELVARYLDREGASLDAETIVRESAGHPMLALELARYLADVHVLGTPNALDSVLWARVERLPEVERELVELVAVAGVPIPREIVDAVHGSDARAPIASLAGQHLLKTSGERKSDLVAPYHDRICETVVGRIDRTRRAAIHRSLAVAFLERGPDTQAHEVVRHLEAAGDAIRAARHAEKAAERASEMLAFDRAATLFRTALRLGDANRDRRQRLLLGLGEALVNAGRSAEAAEVLIDAARDASAATALDCRRRAAEQLLGAGHLERGLEVLRGVLAQIGEAMPSAKAALRSLVWQRIRLRLRGFSWDERDSSRIAPDRLSRLDIYQTVAVLGHTDTILGAYFQAKALRLALELGEPYRLARSFGFEAIYAATQGGREVARAETLVGELRRLADRDQSPYLRALALGTAGVVNMYGWGRFGIAARQLREAEELFAGETVGSQLELSNARLFRLLALRYLGDYREMCQSLHHYVRDAERRGDRFSETTFSRAFNVAWLVDGQPEEARRALAQWSWVPPEGRLHIQHWYELLALVELALYEGDVADWEARFGPRFQALERSTLVRVQMIRTAARWMKARLILAESLGLDNRRSQHRRARRLIDALRREGVPYATVWCDFLDAALYAQMGLPDQAIAALQRTILAAETQERRFYVAVAEMRLADIVGGSEGQSIRQRAIGRIADDRIAQPGALFDVVAPGYPGRKSC
ncbi:MAG: protein kinase [Myxococcales bacterium]|nr:protein kinase [Myxococcales bacterium]